MIFKTFDSDIDKISAKWGIFGHSFNDIGAAIAGRVNDIKKAFQATDDLVGSFKDSDSIWKRLYPSKESIESQLIDVDTLYPDISDTTASKLLSKLQNELVNANKKSWQDYFSGLKEGEKWQIDFVQNTDLQKASLDDVKNAYNSAREAAIAHNAELNQQTLSAKATELGLKALRVAGNMILYEAIAKGLQLAYKAIDNYIHRVDNAKEAMSEFASEAKKGKESLGSQKSWIDSNGKEFEKLAKGVNACGENISLTADEFANYNSMANEVAEMFPTMVSGYTEQGNAIINLKNGVEGLTEAYKENKDAYYNGITGKTNEIVKNFKTSVDDQPGVIGKILKGIGFGEGSKSKLVQKEVLAAFLNSDLDWTKVDEQIYTGELLPDVFYTSGLVKDTLKEAGVEFGFLSDTAKQSKEEIAAILRTLNAEIKSDSSDVIPLLEAWLFNSNNYSQLDDDAKKVANKIINGFSTEFLVGLNSTDYQKIPNMLVDKLKDNEKLSGAFDSLFNFELDDNTTPRGFHDKFMESYDIVSQFCKNNGIEIPVTIEDTKRDFEQLEKRYNKSIKNTKEKYKDDHDFDWDKWFKENSLNTQEELDVWLEIRKAYDDAAEARRALAEQAKVISVDTATEETTALLEEQTTLQEILSTKGTITAENYKELIALSSDYAQCIKYEGNAYVVDQKAANDLFKSKSDLLKTTIEESKASKQLEYHKLASEINDAVAGYNKLTDAEKSELNTKFENISAIETEINQYNMLAQQADDATSAFTNYENAKNAADSGDIYDTSADAFKEMKTAFEETGKYGTNTFEAATELLIPEKEIDKGVSNMYQYYKTTLKRYFSSDDNGKAGVWNFIQDSMNKGLLTKDGLGNYVVKEGAKLEDFQDALHLTRDAVLSLFGEFEEYGYGQNFDWTDELIEDCGDAITELDKLEVNLNESRKKLKEAGKWEDNGGNLTKEAEAIMAGFSKIRVAKDEAAKNIYEGLAKTADNEARLAHAQSKLEEAKDALANSKQGTSDWSKASAEVDRLQTKVERLQAKIVEPTEFNIQVATEYIDKQIEEAKKNGDKKAEKEWSLKKKQIIEIEANTKDADDKTTQLENKVEKLTKDIKDPKKFNIDTTDAQSKVFWLSNTITGLKQNIEELDKMTATVTVNTVKDGDAKTTTKGNKKTKKSNSSGAPSSAAVSGGADVNGTNGAHQAEKDVMVGEIAPEMVVDPNTNSYTIYYRPSMIDLPKNGIVFNGAQTKQILRNGYTASFGQSFVNGTSSGKAYVGTIKGNDPYGNNTPASITKGGSTKKKSSSDKDNKKDKKKEIDYEEFDNIERRLEKISKKISEIQDKISDRNAYAKNMKYIKQLTDYIQKNLGEYEKSYKKYMKMANNIKLPKEYKDLVRNGDLDVLSGNSSNLAKKVANYAEKQVGYHEYGNNGNKYASIVGHSNFQAWCDTFVKAAIVEGLGSKDAAKKALGDANLKSAWTGGTNTNEGSMGEYKKKGNFHKNNPKIGDQIFFYGKDGAGHTGLVTKVNGTKITTVEGNSGDKVSKYTFDYTKATGQRKVIGFGTPDYGESSGKNKKGSITVKGSDGSVKKIRRDSALYEKLEAFQKYYEKAEDAKTSISEIYEKYAEAFKQKFDLTKEKYDNKISKVKKDVEIKEAKNKTASASDYAKIAENSLKKRIDLTKQLNKMVDAGIIDKYSTAWYNMKDAINEATVSLNEYIEKLKNHSLSIEKYNAINEKLDSEEEYRNTFNYSPTSKSRRQEYNAAIRENRANQKEAQEELDTKKTYNKKKADLKKRLKNKEIDKNEFKTELKLAKLEYESNKDIVKNADRADANLRNKKLTDTKRKKIEIRINRKNYQVDNMADRLLAQDEAKGNYTNANYLKSKIESSKYRNQQLSNDLAIVQQQKKNFVGSHNSEEYQKLLEEENAILDAQKDEIVAQQELNKQIKQIPLDVMNDQLDLLEAIGNKLSSANDLTQKLGKDLSESDYYALMANNEAQIKNLQSQITLAWMQFSGGSQDIVTTQSQVAGLEAQINQLKISNIELKDTMRDDVYWRDFARAHEAAENLKTILDSMTGFIDDDMIFVDGQITEFGISKLAALSKEYANAKDDVVNYMNDLGNLEKLYAQGWYTEKDYKEKLQELKEGLLDATQSVKGFSDSVTDMHQKLLQNELDELKDMSESYIEALQKKKDYYDYDKTLRNANKNIQSLKAERAALEGVATAEAKAKKARLDAQIKEAEDELNDTKYEHYITLVTDGLNDTADKLQEKLDDYFEHLATDFDEIANIMLKAAELYESSADTIADSYNKLLGSLGVDTEKHNWNNLTGYASGTKSVDKDKLAWTNENGEEIIIRKSDGAILRQLHKGDSVIPNDLSANLFKWGKMTPLEFASGLVKTPEIPKIQIEKQEPVIINYDGSTVVQGDLVRDTLPELSKIKEESYDYFCSRMARASGVKRTL